MLEHFANAGVLALAEPLRDRLLPDIYLEARGLLDGGERFKLRRF